MADLSFEGYLAQLKRAPVVPAMPSRTDWRTHVDDISVPGQVAPITEHDFRYWLEVLPPRWASGANFCFAEGEEAFRLFWTDSDGGYFVRQLSDDETLLFCDLAGIKPPLIDRGSVSRPTDDGSPWVTVVLPTETKEAHMSHTTLGFGSFRLEDLLAGEEYFASDGRPCQVCQDQPFRPEYVQVWSNVGTLNAVKMLQHRTALVFGTSPEHARKITRRIRDRERRAKQRHNPKHSSVRPESEVSDDG